MTWDPLIRNDKVFLEFWLCNKIKNRKICDIIKAPSKEIKTFLN